METTETEQREATYWDSVADKASLDLDISLDDPLVKAHIELLGDVKGKELLDVGCGTGAWSVFLASRGANVWAVDISPKSIEATTKRARLHGVSANVHASVMSATNIEFAGDTFDIVHGQDIIHHVDADLFGREVAHVLRPEGHAVFHENCANNPLLMLARNNLCGKFGISKWSSDDEYPLTRQKRARFSQFFQNTTLSYPRFVFFHLFDAKLFHYKKPAISRICHLFDSSIYAFPFLRPYSYRQIIRVSQPRAQ